MTNHAKAAAEIRSELKAAGIKASVTSERYSGGSSVNVKISDPSPDTLKRAQDISYKHQRGHFNGMTDSYEYSNRRDDIAQVQFVFVRVFVTADRTPET